MCRCQNLNTPQSVTLHSYLGLSLQVGASSNLLRTSTPSATWLEWKSKTLGLNKSCMRALRLCRIVQVNRCVSSQISDTNPKATQVLSIQGVGCRVMQNWEPLLWGPLLAIPRVPRLVWDTAKLSSKRRKDTCY